MKSDLPAGIAPPAMIFKQVHQSKLFRYSISPKKKNFSTQSCASTSKRKYGSQRKLLQPTQMNITESQRDPNQTRESTCVYFPKGVDTETQLSKGRPSLRLDSEKAPTSSVYEPSFQ
mmetsp:Transcript_17160/g.26538  ORF Transcript_17160/g.26538 Transcript_17160/m.26538 type:complete len:117 (+) Transcript_17160:277-627(+)